MAPPTSTLLLFTAALLIFPGCATAAKQCPLCGTIPVPYPLSTGSDCGDQNYKIRCEAGALKFDTVNHIYSITTVNPSAQRLVIQPSSFVGNACVTADIATLGVQVNGSLPFNITSSNTIMYLNCSNTLMNSPLNCSSNSPCHTYINGTAAASACQNAPICCTFRAGGSTTSYMIRVRESGCRAYRSFVNLDPSLPLSRWPQPGLEMQWVSPPEPVCETQSDCDSNSACGSDPSGNGLRRCYCNSDLRWDPISGSCARNLTCQDPNGCDGSTDRTALIAGILVSIATITIFIITIYCLKRKRTLSINVTAFSKNKRSEDQNVEAFIRQYGSLAPKQYKYSDVNKMTYAFKEKLGEGGYGTVYKGKLSDGRLVAVKILSETKGNGEEFINEVASISRTFHVNVVALLGFCFERNRRALVYEFVANGSLDKFIYNGESLEWKTLYQIAVGTARGLEYLHRGCSTRIVHFDIKPHNILLDKDFYPKISDFGLAKLCQRKQSIISMLGVRGTAGYIAPEVFCRAFGGVSHKSDVYSYGMLVLEIIGARENPGIVQTSEVYFPQWIYEHLEHGKDLRLVRVATREEEETARKMILVGLWCIQTHPSDRPSMSKVLEMLEGSLESLQIPPKPSILSPTRLLTSACESLSSTMDFEVEMSASNPSSFQIQSKPFQFSPVGSGQSASSKTLA